MSRDDKIIVSIALFVLLLLVTVFLIIPAYMFKQSDTLLSITYACTFKTKPNAFSAWRAFDNGTHTIDMDSCRWIKNEYLPPYEYDVMP